MRIVCILLFQMCLLGSILAQQTPVYSQYFMNGFMINPALAGRDGTTKFELSVRDYVIGIKEAPKTVTASANGRFLRKKVAVKGGKPQSQTGRVGMGGFIFSDHNGLVNRTGLQYTYAYHIDLTNSQLSLGLSGALSQTHINASKLDFNDPEPLLQNGFSNLSYVPDASIGIFYKKKEHFVGLTVSNLFQRSISFGEFDYDYVLYRHYFVLAGTSFDIGENAYISPSALFKITSNRAYQAEIAARISYKDEVWLALSYRTPQVASLMIGTHIKRLFIGYSYEYNFNSISSYSYGAQEISLIYRIGDTARRYRWLIRY